MNKKSVLIVGYGNIGTHIHEELRGHDITIFDPAKGYGDGDTLINEYYHFAFVCVPTDMNSDGSCDTSIVESVVRANADVVVIKSTIPVGTTERLAAKYHQNIVFSPEYYGTTIQSPKAPNFLVLGGAKEDCRKVAELYYAVKPADFRIVFTDCRTAELAKYMENCFLALKVTFCAEFATIAKEFGISYPELRDIFVLDERMGKSHTFIDSEHPYYKSHCLDKDIPALIAQSEKAHLMQAVFDINRTKQRVIDY